MARGVRLQPRTSAGPRTLNENAAGIGPSGGATVVSRARRCASLGGSPAHLSKGVRQ
jgi:hypothetical protein